MTVSSAVRKAGPFLGNDAATSFAFTFKVFTASQVRLVHIDADDAETDLTLDSDYSVTLNDDQDNDPGGTIIYPLTGDPLPDGESLMAVSDVPEDQETDLTNMGRFLPQVIENAFDKLTILVQQHAEKLDRTIVASVTRTTEVPALPGAASLSGKYLTFDAEGNPVPSDGTGADATLRADLAASGGSALVGFLQAGAGSVSRSEQSKLREWVSVTDYGAVLDGTTDDTTAFQAAVTYAMANGKAIWIPGKMAIYGPITGTGANAISLLGMGPSVSRIIYMHATASITLTCTSVSSNGEFDISKIAFCAGVDNITLALKLVAVKPPSGRKPVGAMFDHCFFGYDSQTGEPGDRCFARAVHLDTIRESTFNSCMFYGKHQERLGSGVYWEGESTSGPMFTSCQFYHWNYGIEKPSTGVTSGEGFGCFGCIFVTNNYGIHADSPIGDPSVWIDNCHFNNEEGNIWLKNHNQIFLSNNLYYANTASTTFIDVYVEDALGFISHDNIYGQTAAAATAIGIKLVSVSAGIVHDEFFLDNCRAKGLVMDIACTRMAWHNNHWEDIPTPVENGMTSRTRYVRKSYLAPGYVKAHTPAVQSLAHNVATTIIWPEANVTTTFEGGWALANPTRFVVPKDVTLVRFHTQVGFADNATGVRVVRILKNGLTFSGNANHRQNAVSAGPSQMTVSTAMVEVVAGDYFEVEVTQGSGGALDTVGTAQVSATLEIVG